MAALLVLAGCSSSTDPEDSASSIELSATTVSFDRLLATHEHLVVQQAAAAAAHG